MRFTALSGLQVSGRDPADVTLKADYRHSLDGPEGLIQVQSHEVVTSDITSFRYLTAVEITLNGKKHFEKSWRVSVPRGWN